MEDLQGQRSRGDNRVSEIYGLSADSGRRRLRDVLTRSLLRQITLSRRCHPRAKLAAGWRLRLNARRGWKEGTDGKKECAVSEWGEIALATVGLLGTAGYASLLCWRYVICSFKLQRVLFPPLYFFAWFCKANSLCGLARRTRQRKKKVSHCFALHKTEGWILFFLMENVFCFDWLISGATQKKVWAQLQSTDLTFLSILRGPAFEKWISLVHVHPMKKEKKNTSIKWCSYNINWKNLDLLCRPIVAKRQ